jgi:activator of HSP90 ATPase
MSTTAVQGGSSVTFVTNFSGSYYSLNAHPWEQTTTLRLYQRTSLSGDSDTQVDQNQISNTFDCRITVQYMTA